VFYTRVHKGLRLLRMKNPGHPGELIRETLDELGVSITDAANALGVTRQQLHNIVAARSDLTTEMAIRLEKALGSTADTWLRMQVNYNLARARKKSASLKVRRIQPKLA
jgi:addiction module HigA family antidote